MLFAAAGKEAAAGKAASSGVGQTVRVRTAWLARVRVLGGICSEQTVSVLTGSHQTAVLFWLF